MNLSIVIPVLDSHEIVRRQLLHFGRMDLSDDTEIILVDDGSDPPLAENDEIRELLDSGVRIIETHDTRPWTWALARNAGVKVASGECLLMTDIDHILSQALIDTVRNTFDGVKMNFRREFAVLDEDGHLTQDRDTLTAYGLPPDASLRVGMFPNGFAMSRKLFRGLGGYREDLVGNPYPQGEDNDFRRRWQAYQKETGAKLCSRTPTIYTFPCGQFCGDVDHNPFGLFHSLSRKTARNPLWRRQQEHAQ